MRMVKSAALAVLLAGLGSAAALANVGAGLVGNTVTLTGPEGATVMFYYPDDATVVRKAPDGTETEGAWSVNGQDICTTFPGEEEACVTVTETAPEPGASGEVENPETGAMTQWSVAEGKGF